MTNFWPFSSTTLFESIFFKIYYLKIFFIKKRWNYLFWTVERTVRLLHEISRYLNCTEISPPSTDHKVVNFLWTLRYVNFPYYLNSVFKYHHQGLHVHIQKSSFCHILIRFIRNLLEKMKLLGSFLALKTVEGLECYSCYGVRGADGKSYGVSDES